LLDDVPSASHNFSDSQHFGDSHRSEQHTALIELDKIGVSGKPAVASKEVGIDLQPLK